MKGYAGKILHVDLSTRKFTVEEPEEKFYRQYIGGAWRNPTIALMIEWNDGPIRKTKLSISAMT